MRSLRKPNATEDQGAVAIIVAVFAIVAMVLLAFVVDRGRIYVQRVQLQNAVDAAALAAVQATCGNPIADPTAVRTIATTYALNNGVYVDPINVIVQDGPTDGTTGVSVAATQNVPQIFGGFSGISSSNVAARGTATRLCSKTFRIVANSSATFTGSGSSGDAIYGGDCFSTGSNSNVQFGTVAVRQPEASTFCGSSYKDGPISALKDVDDPQWGVNISLSGLATSSGITSRIAAIKSAAGTWKGTCQDLGKQKANEAPWSTGQDAFCTGSNGVNIPVATFGGSIVAEDADLTLGSTVLNGSNQLIYTSASGSNALTFSGTIGDNVTIYAPNGEVVNNSATTINGRILANQVKFAGSGANTGSGFNVRIAGPWRLSQ